MGGKGHVGVASEQDGRLVEVRRPHPGVADHRTAQRHQVVQVAGGVFGHAEGSPVRKMEVHLGRTLGPRGELKDDPHPVEHLFLASAGDVDGRRHQSDRSGRCRHPESAADLSGRTLLQGYAVHEHGPAAHGDPGVHIFGDRRLHESVRGEDRYRAVEYTVHPAEVVNVGVGIDHRRHRPVASVGPVQGQSGSSGLRRNERIDDDDPGVTFNEGHVGQVEASHLVDPVTDLVEPLSGHELPLAPQAGVGGVWAVGIQEAVCVVVPDDSPSGVGDHARLERPHEAAIGICEVGPVIERVGGDIGTGHSTSVAEGTPDRRTLDGRAIAGPSGSRSRSRTRGDTCLPSD